MINLNLYKNKKIALLGAGVETYALAKYYSSHQISCGLFEQKPSRIQKHKEYVADIYTGKEYLSNIKNYDIIIRSPGYPLKKIQQEAKKYHFKGKISSATKIFFDLCPSKIIGVTGTKGKGTTSSLIYQILRFANKHVFLSGNIGSSPFDFIDELDKNSFVVLELSSFQLEDLEKSPNIAVVLEISPDHLKPLSSESPNFHKSLDDYIFAKSNIVAHQKKSDWAILNRDHHFYKKIQKSIKGKLITVSTNTKTADLFLDNYKIVSKNDSYPMIDAQKRNLLGMHNLENIIAAVAVANCIGIDKKIIEEAIKQFKGLPHRIKLVEKFKKIRFYDDSYATSPAATIAAIDSFNTPISLIAGGSSKGADFDKLCKKIRNSKVNFVSLIGEEAKNIACCLDKNNFNNYQIFNRDFKKAILCAIEKISGEGIVLLSPACASKDMFLNASNRGEQFLDVVRGIKNELR